MVLVKCFGIVLAAVETGQEVLCETDQGLNGDQDVCDQAENRVRRDKMSAAVVNLVVLDDDEACNG